MSARSLRTLAGAICGVVLISASAWALWPQEQDILPKELSVASLKERFEDPERAGPMMRETFEREDLSDAQRQALRSNMRQVFRDMMNERVDEYFTASEEDKVAVLDRHIDEFMERMERFRQMREQQRQDSEEDAEARERRREEGRRRWGGGTTEQRKARSESRNADEMARHMVYMTAMRSRMAERGINMPRFGPGRGGPGGPGRGPRGGRGAGPP